MNAGQPEVSWRLLHGAVKGVAKRYSQDHGTARRTVDGRGVLLAVADGHGSAAHHRSDLGSRWAVEAFTACADSFAEEAARRGDDPANWPALREYARSLPRQIVRLWRERVVLHECNAPADGTSTAGPAPQPDFVPYGSTLIGAVATGRLLVCWQLGDGDVVLVGKSGDLDAPLYEGPDLGDETQSLCEPEAWRQMRVHWQPFTGPGTAPTVLLSTDGLSKSFADRSGFVAFARGLRDRSDEQGLPAVQAQLGDWLARAAAYSGDDTTLMGAFPVSEHDQSRHDAPDRKGRES